MSNKIKINVSEVYVFSESDKNNGIIIMKR